MDKSKRAFQKCGSRDPESLWAKARVQLCTQFCKQLMLGVRQDPLSDQYEHDIFPLTELEGEEITGPLQLNAIAWWDEHHKKCILGHVCKRETRIWKDTARLNRKMGGGCYRIRSGNLLLSLCKRLEVALVWQCYEMLKDMKE
jgi:hypothetical protein